MANCTLLSWRALPSSLYLRHRTFQSHLRHRTFQSHLFTLYTASNFAKNFCQTPDTESGNCVALSRKYIWPCSTKQIRASRGCALRRCSGSPVCGEEGAGRSALHVSAGVTGSMADDGGYEADACIFGGSPAGESLCTLCDASTGP